MTNDDEYKPNKYTRRISNEDWARIQRDGGGRAVLINPGYLNEPGDHPWRDEIAWREKNGH